MTSNYAIANRLGFFTLGLSNNFAYVIMLAAAFDLLKESTNHLTRTTSNPSNSTSYCNSLSTSTILLADVLPSLMIKLSYPFLLLNVPGIYKVTVAAALSGISFIVTGFANSQLSIFFGVISASFSSGLGESTFLTSIPSYGDASLSGWSMGTGAAGLLGAIVYAVLRIYLPIELIMIMMLVMPLSMMLAYSFVIKPVDDTYPRTSGTASSNFKDSDAETDAETDAENSPLMRHSVQEGDYGATHGNRRSISRQPAFGLQQKLRHIPKLSRYFLPLFLVYFAEYFINQGLFELIYFPEMTKLDHASQYSWFQVSYQLGVFISRSSLDLFKIKQLWLMALLQVLNAILFLTQAARVIHIPSFYIVILLIIYEGLLGGFTYTNTFDRMKSELPKQKREFSMGVVTTADTLGIVSAALVALPVHDALCKIY